jgi:hypothetical protein
MMQERKFDAFGEPLAMADSLAPAPSSRWLMRAGTGLFWSLVTVIVLARAIYFEPGVFDGLDRAVAFAQGLLASL